MTFNELTEWYLDQPDRKSKKFYKTIQYNLNSFNHDFGSTIIGYLRPIDLKNYQSKRKSEGKSDSYIDQEIGAARTMIRMAYDNDIISLEPVMVFSKVKKLLKKNSNALYKVLSKIPRYIHDNHVFLYARMPGRDIRAGLIRACDDAGIKYGRKEQGGFVYHDLRHCFTTYMRKAGVAK